MGWLLLPELWLKFVLKPSTHNTSPDFLSGTISTAPYLPTGLKLPRQSCFLFICSSKTVSRDYSTKLSVATLAQHSHSDRLCPQLIRMQIMQCLIHMQIPPPTPRQFSKRLSVCSWVAEQLGPELLLEQYWEEEAVSEKAGERWKAEMLLILTQYTCTVHADTWALGVLWEVGALTS